MSRPTFQWIPHTHRLLYTALGAGEDRSIVCSLDIESGVTRFLVEGQDAAPSPDGTRLAFLSAAPGVKTSQLWAVGIEGTKPVQLTQFEDVTEPTAPAKLGYQWSPDSKRILYWRMEAQADGSINYGARRPDAIQARYGSRVRTYPHFIDPAVQLSSVDLYYKFYVLDLATRRATPVLQGEGALPGTGWLTAQSLYYTSQRPGSHPMRYRSSIGVYDLKTQVSRAAIEHFGVQGVFNPKVSPTGRFIAFQADPGMHPFPAPSDLAVYSKNHPVRLLTKNSLIQLGAWTPNESGIVFTDGTATHRDLHYVSTSGRRERLTNESGRHGQPQFSSDGQWLAWTYTQPNNVTTLRIARWKGSVAEEARDLLTLDDPGAGLPIGRTSAVTWKSQDGLELDGYLTLPADYDFGKRYPLITVVHGGPTNGLGSHVGTETLEWPGGYYFSHLWASYGYAVFLATYRASGNFGFDKLEDARGPQKFQRDYEDIEGGVRHLVDAGVADPSRLFLLGHSAGGYTVNWIVTHSARFRAAVSYDGIGDMLLSWGHNGWGDANLSWQWFMGGSTPMQEPEAWFQNSPIMSVLRHPQRIRTPTMFVKSDSSMSRSDDALFWLYVAFRNLDVDTQYILYPDDGHVVARPENRTDLLHRLLDWVARHDVPDAPEPVAIRISLQ